MTAPAKTYSWKAGAPFGTSAKDAGPWLEKLVHSGASADDVLAEAAKLPADHSIRHDLCLDRSDEHMAVEARRARARLMLRSIEVVVRKVGDGTPRRLTTVVKRMTASKPVDLYETRADALTDPFKRKQMVDRGWQLIDSWIRSHGDIPEFGDLIEAIEQVRGSGTDLEEAA